MSAAIFHLRTHQPLTPSQQAKLTMEQAAGFLDTEANATGDWEPRFLADALRQMAERRPGATLCVVRAWSLLRSGGSCGT